MDDDLYMKQALELAEKGRGRTSPNPMVGAVILRDGRVVGQGFHAQAGLPHAEINALAQAGERAAGATMYVTLEPCCHSGRTPPCTEAIIQAGIRKVICPLPDPNPKVSCGGIDVLRRAGIEVKVGLMAQEAERQNEAYFQYITTGLPFVTLKIAQTIDAKIAASDGGSRWISGEAARRYVHRLRSYHDAVLVGINTVITDDPELTVRAVDGRNAARMVLDSRLRTPLQSKLLTGIPGARTIIVTSDRVNPSKAERVRATGAEIWTVPLNDEGRLDLRALLRRAATEHFTSVLVEGGATLFTAFIEAQLTNRIHVFIAPIILGSGRPSIQHLGIESLAQALRFREVEVLRFGEDILVSGYVGE